MSDAMELGGQVGASAICSECGGKVKAWNPPGRPVPAGSQRLKRRVVLACVLAVGVAGAMYIASGRWSLYCKGPGGWYVALWHGYLAAGRSEHRFDRLGFESQRSAPGFSLRFRTQSELIGSLISVPLWIPIPVVVAVGLAAWWRTAVRRGLALHWPPPT